MAERVLRRGRLGCMVLALGILGMALFGHAHEDSRRLLGERFSSTLEAPSAELVEAYFAPDAGVFLQGAETPISPSALSAYLQRLKAQNRFFHRVSRVYVTPSGFGWLVATSGLWLEATVENDRITRVWMEDATPAMLTAAERMDRQADDGDAINLNAVVGLGACVAGLLLALEVRRVWPTKPLRTGQLQDGRLLLALRRARETQTA